MTRIGIHFLLFLALTGFTFGCEEGDDCGSAISLGEAAAEVQVTIIENDDPDDPYELPELRYTGCFPEINGQLTFPSDPTFSSPGMTDVECGAICRELEFDFAALALGSRCRCANNFGFNGKRLDGSECGKPCAGDVSRFCGAESDDKHSVYRIVKLTDEERRALRQQRWQERIDRRTLSPEQLARLDAREQRIAEREARRAQNEAAD